MTAKHAIVALLAAAVVLIAPFAIARESHLLIDGPQISQQD